MNKADDILERLKGQQPMIDDPDALTEQIMRSIEASPILADGEEKVSARTVPLWRWLSIAASIILLIGIGVTLWPTEEQESKSLVAETTVQPKVKAAMPEEPKVEEIKAEPTKRETAKPRTQKQKPTPTTPPSAPKPLLAQESAPAKAAADLQLAVSHEPTAKSQKLTAMSPKPKADSQKQAAKSVELTESDIPITRPENYKYTPEEIALLKKQANEAYLKWVELELEIAKHSQEQTAQQY